MQTISHLKTQWLLHSYYKKLGDQKSLSQDNFVLHISVIKVSPYSSTMHTSAGDESSSNLRGHQVKRHAFRYFDVIMSTKSKTDSEFSCVSFGEIP